MKSFNLFILELLSSLCKGVLFALFKSIILSSIEVHLIHTTLDTIQIVFIPSPDLILFSQFISLTIFLNDIFFLLFEGQLLN